MPADPAEAARVLGEKIMREYDLDAGADVVLECTGAEACIQAGVFAAKKGGTFVQAGMGKEVSGARIHVAFFCFRRFDEPR